MGILERFRKPSSAETYNYNPRGDTEAEAVTPKDDLESAIAAATHEENLNRAAAENFFARVAMRNHTTESGTVFEFPLPGRLAHLDTNSLHTESTINTDSPKPLLIGVEGGVARFQATTTKTLAIRAMMAIEIYEEPSTSQNNDADVELVAD